MINMQSIKFDKTNSDDGDSEKNENEIKIIGETNPIQETTGAQKPIMPPKKKQKIEEISHELPDVKDDEIDIEINRIEEINNDEENNKQNSKKSEISTNILTTNGQLTENKDQNEEEENEDEDDKDNNEQTAEHDIKVNAENENEDNKEVKEKNYEPLQLTNETEQENKKPKIKQKAKKDDNKPQITNKPKKKNNQEQVNTNNQEKNWEALRNELRKEGYHGRTVRSEEEMTKMYNTVIRANPALANQFTEQEIKDEYKKPENWRNKK